MPLGEMKQVIRQLQFIDSIRFMASSLDSLSVSGMNGMVCEECRREAELMHIDENYITHRTCGKCGGAIHCKLEIDPIFNESVVWTNSSDCCSEREFILMNRLMIGRSPKKSKPTLN